MGGEAFFPFEWVAQRPLFRVSSFCMPFIQRGEKQGEVGKGSHGTRASQRVSTDALKQRLSSSVNPVTRDRYQRIWVSQGFGVFMFFIACVYHPIDWFHNCRLHSYVSSSNKNGWKLMYCYLDGGTLPACLASGIQPQSRTMPKFSHHE